MSNQTWKVAETIGMEQAQALDEVLRLLDTPAPQKFLALLGGKHGASALLGQLTSDANALRTPSHRKLLSVVIDASRLPTHIEAWQHLLFSVLDRIGQTPTAPQNVVSDLRSELNELIQAERRREPATALASAAFAHHFRTAFPGLVSSAVAASNAILVVGVDRLDQAGGVWAMDLLEASRYFLSSPDCATVIAADEQALLDKLKSTGANGDRMLATWPSDRVAVPRHTMPDGGGVIRLRDKSPLRPATGAAAPANAAVESAPNMLGGKRGPLSTLPSESSKVIREMLSPDQRAIDVACHEWTRAIAGLTRRNEEGANTRISGAHMAKLVVLKQLSPRLFDAARFEAPLLARLERAARSGNADMKDDNQRVMAMNPSLTALFKSAPQFIGIDPRDVATALRLVFGGEPEPAAASLVGTPADAARANVMREAPATRGRAAREPVAISLPPVAMLPLAFIGTLLADRLTKAALQAAPALPNLTTSSLVTNSLMLGMELLGLAMTVLIIGFWGASRRNRLYQAAFGMIAAGLLSNLYDHVTLGGMLNFIPLLGVSVNIAHLALAAGAVLMALAGLFQRERAV